MGLLVWDAVGPNAHEMSLFTSFTRLCFNVHAVHLKYSDVSIKVVTTSHNYLHDAQSGGKFLQNKPAVSCPSCPLFNVLQERRAVMYEAQYSLYIAYSTVQQEAAGGRWEELVKRWWLVVLFFYFIFFNFLYTCGKISSCSRRGEGNALAKFSSCTSHNQYVEFDILLRLQSMLKKSEIITARFQTTLSIIRI